MTTEMEKEEMDISDYVNDLLEDESPVVVAGKQGCVAARQVTDPHGEDLVTYVQDGTKETTNHANPGDWILTNVDSKTGEPVIDKDGHANEWAVPEVTFQKKYDVDHPDPHGNFVPKGEPQIFIKVDHDISFTAPWGEQQNIKEGGYLNITSPNDIYGIAKDEFYQTYDVYELHVAKEGREEISADMAEYSKSFENLSVNSGNERVWEDIQTGEFEPQSRDAYLGLEHEEQSREAHDDFDR